jgi:hypothetical protein
VQLKVLRVADLFHGGDEFFGVRQNGVLQVFIVWHGDIFL